MPSVIEGSEPLTAGETEACSPAGKIDLEQRIASECENRLQRVARAGTFPRIIQLQGPFQSLP